VVARKQDGRGGKQREREGSRDKIFSSKVHPSDPLPLANFHLLLALSAMNSLMDEAIDKGSTLKIKSPLNNITSWGPHLQHMSLLGGHCL
jgi:hypothetical protein